MGITKNFNRGTPQVAEVEINLADVATGVASAAIDLPADAVILSGSGIYTETAWNSTTSDVMSVGDSDSGTAYLNGGNIRAAGAFVPLVPTGKPHPGGSLTVTWTSGGGTPTTGKSRLLVVFYQLGSSTHTYG